MVRYTKYKINGFSYYYGKVCESHFLKHTTYKKLAHGLFICVLRQYFSQYPFPSIQLCNVQACISQGYWTCSCPLYFMHQTSAWKDIYLSSILLSFPYTLIQYKPDIFNKIKLMRLRRSFQKTSNPSPPAYEFVKRFSNVFIVIIVLQVTKLVLPESTRSFMNQNVFVFVVVHCFIYQL